LCDTKKEIKTNIKCQTNEGIKIGDSITKLVANYGSAEKKNDTFSYRYEEYGAKVKVENDKITSIEIYSYYP